MRFTTPRPVFALLILLAAGGLLLPLLPLSVSRFLALSVSGIQALHLWQLVTYPLLSSSIVTLAFNLFLIWAFTSPLVERFGTLSVSLLILSATALGGLASALLLFFTHSTIYLTGSTPLLYGILGAWIASNPNALLWLFFAIPFRARTLLLSLIGLNIWLDLSAGAYPHALACLTSTLAGTAFARLFWRSTPLFHRSERSTESSKIYDFQTGQPREDDEAFMDAMLAKISRSGEESLTTEERRRMQEISQRKRRE